MKTMRGATLALTALLMLSASAWAADDSLRAKALKLNEVTGDDAAKAKTIELIKDAKGTKELLAEAAKIVKEKDQPFNVNATLILARAAHVLRQYDIGERFYRVNLNQATKLESANKIGTAYTGLSQLLFDNKKYADSQKVCQEFIELADSDEELGKALNSFRFGITSRFVFCLVKLDQVDKAKKMLDNLIEDNPQNWLLLEVKARVLREIDDQAGAAKVYDAILDRIAKDKRLEDKDKKEFSNEIKYSLTGVYIELKKVDKAIDLLKELVKDEPDNPTYNNDLGYIMADNDKDLDEAEKLIRKALDEDRKLRKKDMVKPEDDKDNPSYVDSLGWVQYKKKNYKDAKVNLVKAIKDEEDNKSIELYDHLAEICWALGEKKEAIEAWKKGIEFAGKSKREQAKKTEVEKKIQEKEKK